MRLLILFSPLIIFFSLSFSSQRKQNIVSNSTDTEINLNDICISEPTNSLTVEQEVSRLTGEKTKIENLRTKIRTFCVENEKCLKRTSYTTFTCASLCSFLLIPFVATPIFLPLHWPAEKKGKKVMETIALNITNQNPNATCFEDVQEFLKLMGK